jgi:hypothetical protein
VTEDEDGRGRARCGHARESRTGRAASVEPVGTCGKRSVSGAARPRDGARRSSSERSSWDPGCTPRAARRRLRTRAGPSRPCALRVGSCCRDGIQRPRLLRLLDGPVRGEGMAAIGCANCRSVTARGQRCRGPAGRLTARHAVRDRGYHPFGPGQIVGRHPLRRSLGVARSDAPAASAVVAVRNRSDRHSPYFAIGNRGTVFQLSPGAGSDRGDGLPYTHRPAGTRTGPRQVWPGRPVE